MSQPDRSSPPTPRVILKERRGHLAGLLRPWVQRHGARLIEARTFGDCLRSAAGHSAPIVILDEGTLTPETLAGLDRLLTAVTEAKVVVLGPSLLEAPAVQALREAGALHVVPRPLSRDRLLAVLRRLLGVAAPPDR